FADKTQSVPELKPLRWDVEVEDPVSDDRKSNEGIGLDDDDSRVASKRVLDTKCPICLGRFDKPVTLCSCLHTYCYDCIFQWYEHVLTTALSRPSQVENSGAALFPYRCPLCQTPGPYFLAVEAEDGWGRGSPSTGAAAGLKPKLCFKLFGARAVAPCGGVSGSRNGDTMRVDGRKSDGQTMPGARGADKNGYPKMEKLRKAVRTQLALAAAVTAEEEKKHKGVEAGVRGRQRQVGDTGMRGRGGQDRLCRWGHHVKESTPCGPRLNGGSLDGDHTRRRRADSEGRRVGGEGWCLETSRGNNVIRGDVSVQEEHLKQATHSGDKCDMEGGRRSHGQRGQGRGGTKRSRSGVPCHSNHTRHAPPSTSSEAGHCKHSCKPCRPDYACWGGLQQEHGDGGSSSIRDSAAGPEG
ncbi:unnamed protein product, partial [Discosporangium mesarthrocarpum]